MRRMLSLPPVVEPSAFCGESLRQRASQLVRVDGTAGRAAALGKRSTQLFEGARPYGPAMVGELVRSADDRPRPVRERGRGQHSRVARSTHDARGALAHCVKVCEAERPGQLFSVTGAAL